MRLLFVSNFYPPHGQGGYELWCQEVAKGLSTKGHELLVLTSRHGGQRNSCVQSLRVHRQLYLEMELDSWRNVFLFFVDRRRRELANLTYMHQQIVAFAPDAILIWGMWNLPRSLAALAERIFPQRTVYYFGDYWPTLPNQWIHYWYAPARSSLISVPKRLLRALAKHILAREQRLDLCYPHALFPSEFMRRAYTQAKVKIGRAHVIYGGVDTRPYYRVSSQRSLSKLDSPLRLLVVGRLVPDKGIHTAIEALAVLVQEHSLYDLHLTIVGTGEPAYVSHLQGLAKGLGVEESVWFLGAVPQDEMPDLYGQHDVFVFPSVWPEPFGRVLVEAMAAGLAVVGTTVGGAGEILRDGETGLAFPPEDAEALAAQVVRLVSDVDLRLHLVHQGQTYALAHFDIEPMTRAIEQYIQIVVNSS